MKKVLSLALVISLILPLNSYADTACAKPVTLLNTGDQSPCKGYLFSPEQEHKMYLLDQNSKLMQQELDIKTKYIDTVNKELSDYQGVVDKEKQQSELWREAAENSTKKLIETKNDTWKRDAFVFFLGVLTTIGAAYAFHQAATH